MTHVHFHLTMDGEYFPDPVGEKVDDLPAAHARAVALASRVMAFCAPDGEQPRAERGVVTIADDAGRTLMSVIVRRGSTTRDLDWAVRGRRRVSRPA